MSEQAADEIRVLVVDDNADQAETAALFLEEVNERIAAETVNSGEKGIERLQNEEFNCVISDYDMPGQNGIDFLETVRSGDIDVPFILFTGKGSEEIASEAISAGVTDYLQKGTGTSQYDVLANRIENAVDQNLARRELEETTQFYRTVLRHSSDFVMVVDAMGEVSYISPAVERMLGYTPQEVRNMNAFEFVHPEDEARAANSLAKNIEQPEREHTVEFRARHDNGEYRWLEVRGRNLLEDPVIAGIMVNVRDITERKRREQALETEKSRLADLTEHLSHDVRNQLNVIDSRLELAMEEVDSDHLEPAQRAANRVDEMLAKTRELAESGQLTADPAPISIAELARRCWENVGTASAELIVEEDLSFRADAERLRSLLENLMINAMEHSGDEVTIWVGPLTDNPGFYVADDGPGIPPNARDSVFEAGYTTSDDGPGLGLRIVKAIGEAHDWELSLVESREGGARFEFARVDLLE